MKGSALIIFCAVSLAFGEETILRNENGCPSEIHVHTLLPDDKYCNKFYSCLYGEQVELICPGGLLFNPLNMVCDWPQNVDCGEKGIFETTPGNKEDNAETNPGGNNDPSQAPQICAQEGSDGVLVAHEDCDKFYKCDRGYPAPLNCPAGLLYNSNFGICDWPQNVDCGDRVRPKANSNDEADKVHEVQEGDNNNDGEKENSPASGGYGNSDHSQAQAICAEEDSDGVLVAHENCNQFYKCYQRIPVAMDCPFNLLYNPETEICDWPQNVDCGDRINGSRR